jgi:hypothetical protein
LPAVHRSSSGRDLGGRQYSEQTLDLVTDDRKDLGELEGRVKIVKILGIVLAGYVGIVALFESLLGHFQPAGGTTIVITTTDGSGRSSDRVVSRLDSGGRLYIAANHWPRAWYRRVLEHPDLQVTADGQKRAYRAVQVSPEEHDRINAEHPLGVIARVLTGFPPRRFVRLDPVG